ncbi:phosphatase PAP2 family protein [Pseudobacter ginsenosidimutans]|uniref:PAP2 superfamily protein n=1 Tax=Pseudobacter ginsenosidimutans TaxID=661488 RepID=A0A4Q7MQS3_9BACT|nr:phosphatase PAP2 family protein [Pseudobacter ginsenosidimutans]QEC42075.1 phosphatase PAP2 family protein [Pseudobacter ginsenosidimutans]RZS71086.1 PAP2 superfamily protein [Pseudobacter ginsenosidimutans]
MKLPFPILLVLSLSVQVCRAQSPGTMRQDSLAVKKPFPKYQILIPATMITYGIVSIKNEELKEVNSNMKEELWTERSHKQLSIDNYLQWAPAVAVYGLNAMGIKGAHNFRDRTIIYGLSTAIMSSIVFTGKSISKEWRPDGSNSYSFPSGHTANAFAAAEFLRREYKDVSVWYGVAGYAVAATTGYLRMYNNKHWLSDVVAGAGVGILSTDLAYYLYPSVKRIFEKKKNKPVVAVPFYSGGAVGVSLVYQF